MITASAPGTLVVFGEHAVLQEGPAILAACSARAQVSVILEGSGLWAISDIYGAIDLRSRHVPPTFSFVSAAFDHYRDRLPSSSLTLKIDSDIPDNVGLGSSAAVTVATLTALWGFVNRKRSLEEKDRYLLWETARSIVRQIQGLGSGADVASSIWGGVILYEPEKSAITHLTDELPLVGVYSGAKRPTPEVVMEVQERFALIPKVRDALFQVSKELVEQAVREIQSGNLKQLGRLINIAQGLMESYGVSNVLLRKLVSQLRAQEGILGAKISGAGLGDCVIGLGTLGEESDERFDPYPVFSIDIALQGVAFESL